MALEWLRRRDTALDANLRKFLFTSGPITEIGDETSEVETGGGQDPATEPAGSLGIGSLKGMVR